MVQPFPNFNVIAAVDAEGGIGKNGVMPWHFKEDMQYFKNLTKGAGDNVVIMGRKTFQSMNYRPLPYRTNIVISSSADLHSNHHNPSCNLYVLRCIEDALGIIPSLKCDDVWVIGGNLLYSSFMYEYSQLVKNVYLTHIPNTYDCDVHFPKIPDNFSMKQQHHVLDGLTILIFAVYENKEIEE